MKQYIHYNKNNGFHLFKTISYYNELITLCYNIIRFIALLDFFKFWLLNVFNILQRDLNGYSLYNTRDNNITLACCVDHIFVN